MADFDPVSYWPICTLATLAVPECPRSAVTSFQTCEVPNCRCSSSLDPEGKPDAVYLMTGRVPAVILFVLKLKLTFGLPLGAWPAATAGAAVPSASAVAAASHSKAGPAR